MPLNVTFRFIELAPWFQPLQPFLLKAQPASIAKSRADQPRHLTNTKFVQESKVDDQSASRSDGAIFCARCAALITREAFRVERAGADRHTKVNPASSVFEIACFSQANGCTVHGTPTSEHTWFAGYRWQYAHCRSCET